MKGAAAHPETATMFPIRPTIAAVLLAAACVVPSGACLAQGRDGNADATADAEPPAPNQPRSAFGKVMGVMIGALQRQSHERAHPSRHVRTTASGTPIGIEVGAAFRDAGFGQAAADAGEARAPATPTNATGTGGAVAAPAPPAAPPEDSGLPPAALAGPG